MEKHNFEIISKKRLSFLIEKEKKGVKNIFLLISRLGKRKKQSRHFYFKSLIVSVLNIHNL